MSIKAVRSDGTAPSKKELNKMLPTPKTKPPKPKSQPTTTEKPTK